MNFNAIFASSFEVFARVISLFGRVVIVQLSFYVLGFGVRGFDVEVFITSPYPEGMFVRNGIATNEYDDGSTDVLQIQWAPTVLDRESVVCFSVRVCRNFLLNCFFHSTTTKRQLKRTKKKKSQRRTRQNMTVLLWWWR